MPTFARRPFVRFLLGAAALVLAAGAITYARAALSTAPTGQKSWYWQNPIPQGNTLYGVDAEGSSDVWAVGGPGVVLHSSDDGVVWEPQDSGTSVILRAVDFVDNQNGWIVGDRVTGAGSPGVIKRTSDGGSTWTTQTSTPAVNQNLNGISMVDDQTGWAVGAAGTILKTSNGTAWTPQVSNTTQALYGVAAPDSTHAWAVGAAGTVRATTNGSTWSTQTVPVATALRAVSFPDTQNGFVVGDAGTFLRTSNGGSTWTTVTIQYRGATGTTVTQTGNLAGVSFRSATTGWVVGAGGRILFTTNDGGLTWTDQSSGAQQLNCVSAGAGSKAYAVGVAGATVRTVDDGLTWNTPQQGTTVQLNGVNWVGPTSQVIVGNSGLVMKTEDSGDTWQTRTSGASNLLASDFADSQVGWAVGAGGTVRKTTDAAETWILQGSGTAVQLNSVAAVSTSTALAVGAGGKIIKTTDGGVTWYSPSSGTTRALYDVYFIDAANGWVVGQTGTILRTSDGGETWAPAPSSGTAITIYSVHFTDASNGWLVGSGGAVRRTTNGGASWTTQTPLTTAYTYYAVDMVDASVGWVVGGAPAAGSVPAQSAVLYTSDGGASWVPQQAGFNGNLRAVSALDTMTVGAVGASGAIRRTNDGGANWLQDGFASVANFTDVSFVSTSTGYAVGAAGSIARTKNGGISWGSLVSGTTSQLNGVDFPAVSTGWVVGAAGAIRKTIDGQSWAPQTSGITTALNGVDFSDTSNGVVVGASGVALTTADGGATWVPRTSGVSATTALYGVAMVDSLNAFYWGAGGVVGKSTDGGSTWTTQTITGSALYAGAFLDASNGWVAGANGVLFRTQDGGATWVAQSSGVTTAIYGIGFLDADRGFLVGGATNTSSFVRETLNGSAVTGSTWTAQIPGTVNILRSVGFIDADHGWIVGDSGTILRTTDNSPPVTTMSIEPADPDGLNGWYVATPTVSVVSDEPGITYYSWSSGTGPWSTYSLPIVPLSQGVSTLHYYSIDPGGNKETVKNGSLKVDTSPPSAPTDVAASPVATGAVDVAWSASSDSVSGVDYYEVLVDGSVVTSSTTTSATVSGLATETAYSFTVVAYDAAGNSSAESSASAAITLAEFPRPPRAVYAQAFGGYGVLVNWSESTGTVPPVQYRVWRSAAGASFSAIGTVTAGGSLSYSDSTAPPGVELRYAISTVDARGEGGQSAPAAMSTTTSTVLPAPAGIRVTNTNSVLVTWTPVPGADGYHVYRSLTSTSQPETRTAAPVASPSFTDTTTPYTEYWYRVAAIDTAGVLGLLSAPAYIRTAGTSTIEPPHGAYSTDTDMCAVCHSTHASTSPISLLKGTDGIDAPLCFSCHDGTAAPDILSEYLDESRASRHPVPIGTAPGTMQCSDCHGVHSAEQTETVKGLLLAGDKKSGNEYCYECHGATPGTVPRGDLRGFEQSAHGTGVPEPASGTKVVCLSCHVSHTSSQPSLYPYAVDDRCMNCHSAGGLAGSRTNIAARLSGPDSTTRHDLRAADMSANGSRLSCGNCHEPHSSTATTPCVDPDRPTTSGAMATGTALCLRCHDDALPSSIDTSGWAEAPLAAGGATATLDVKSSWETTSVHGAGASVSPNLRLDMGFSAGDELTCASCHDSHGSVNRFTLLESVRSKSGTASVDSLLVFPMPSGGADLRFFCASCHDVTPANHPGPGVGGADLTVWPLDCTVSGCHNHAGNGL